MDFEEALTAAQTVNADLSPIPSPVSNVLHKLEKWNLVPNCGQVLRNTNLIPIKTPIRNEYIIKARKASQRLLREQSEEELQYFGLQAFCEQSAENGLPIGLIIDLSNHDSLYDIPTDIQYHKLALEAKKIPSLSTVKEFCRVVDDFNQLHPKSNDNNQYPYYIAVHCSYSFNRTGFILCSYLCEKKLVATVQEALDAFKEARNQVGMKHEWMVEELRNRYEKV